MDCSAVRQRLGEWVDGELPPHDRGALEAHLAGCEECNAEATSLRGQDAEIREAFRPERAAAKRVAARVVERLRAEPSVAVHKPVRHWLSLTAAVAAGFLLGALVFRSGPESQPMTRVSASLSSASPASSSSPAVATLVASIGDVELKPNNWSSVAPNLGMLTCPSDSVIRTGDASCELKTADGCVIRLNKETEVALKSADSIEVRRGQVWCSSPNDVSLKVIVVGEPPTTGAATPATTAPSTSSAWVTCNAQSSLMAAVAPGNVQVSSAIGNVTLRTPTGEERLQRGETASIVAGRVVRATEHDPLLAAGWMNPLLVRKGNDDPELAQRIDRILAQLGQSKLSYLYEQEIRALGEHAVLPLARYVQSPLSKNDPTRRATAMRIIADIAPTWSIGTLIELLADDDGATRVLAAQALERLTGETQGRSPQEWRGDPKESAQALEAWRRWWTERRDRIPRRSNDA